MVQVKGSSQHSSNNLQKGSTVSHIWHIHVTNNDSVYRYCKCTFLLTVYIYAKSVDTKIGLFHTSRLLSLYSQLSNFNIFSVKKKILLQVI